MSYDKEKTEENDGNMARTSLNIARKMNSDWCLNKTFTSFNTARKTKLWN
jgi:hypothetical protein